jgi:hypothetical protein
MINPKDLNLISHVCNAWKNDMYMYITPIGVEYQEINTRIEKIMEIIGLNIM